MVSRGSSNDDIIIMFSCVRIKCCYEEFDETWYISIYIISEFLDTYVHIALYIVCFGKNHLSG